MSAAQIAIAPANLSAYIRAIVAGTGSSAREAELTADNLVLANLSGHDSHGVGMIPAYVGFALGGGLVPNQHARVTADLGSMVMIDGCRGYGQVIGHEAMRIGVERARAHGLALVALSNSHHIGRIGQWAEDCAAAGMVSLHFVNAVLRPLVAPFAGSDARFATNPFCCGIPRGGEEPLILDFATSRIALGKVRVARQEEKTLAPGTLIDGAGNPSTDPRVMYERDVAGRLGAILPFGEHKGYGMAVICEILGGALTGGKTLHEDSGNFTGIYNNMLSIIIDPERLGGATFHAERDAFIDWVRASPAAPGHDRVRIAGEPEREMRARRSQSIPIDANTWRDIEMAARKVGLTDADIARFCAGARPI
ncbi:MAG: malate/lactate/ureidoglycolate dehydrogenase [Burkholderiales bacterium]|nr:malate/lactate/ureidoglycolate dehydrogenase [Burkholderiales bacterium]